MQRRKPFKRGSLNLFHHPNSRRTLKRSKLLAHSLSSSPSCRSEEDATASRLSQAVRVENNGAISKTLTQTGRHPLPAVWQQTHQSDYTHPLTNQHTTLRTAARP